MLDTFGCVGVSVHPRLLICIYLLLTMLTIGSSRTTFVQPLLGDLDRVMPSTAPTQGALQIFTEWENIFVHIVVSIYTYLF